VILYAELSLQYRELSNKEATRDEVPRFRKEMMTWKLEMVSHDAQVDEERLSGGVDWCWQTRIAAKRLALFVSPYNSSWELSSSGGGTSS